MGEFVRGTPKALLLVEFSEELPGADLGGKLNQLEELLSELGHPDSVVRAETESLQSAAWSVRKPQYRDVDGRSQEANLLHRGLCGAT